VNGTAQPSPDEGRGVSESLSTFMVYGLWSMVYGSRFMIFYLWLMVYGLGLMIYNLWLPDRSAQ
jgi:hypothetical protein